MLNLAKFASKELIDSPLLQSLGFADSKGKLIKKKVYDNTSTLFGVVFGIFTDDNPEMIITTEREQHPLQYRHILLRQYKIECLDTTIKQKLKELSDIVKQMEFSKPLDEELLLYVINEINAMST